MSLFKKFISFTHLIILLSLLFNCTLLIGQNNSVVASKFIDSLKKVSLKEQHGTSLNKYFIIDLNNDDTYEVIERKNRIELEYPGFLPSNISPAFDYDIIYSFENGTFLRANKKFIDYLNIRKSHYEFWLELITINKTSKTDSDSFKIIRYNNDYFQEELTRLIKLIEMDIND